MTASESNVPDAGAFEKLASFYLGRRVDPQLGEPTPELMLYDSKDLCTHAVCVGMTGSGKTGLCLSLLEEAAIDGVPAICVDPKGDLANLALAFPELRPSDFRPWLDPAAAARRGWSIENYAERTATTWREGLASWGQSPDRVRRFRDAADVAIYTPGSRIGLPLTVLQSFDAPPPEVLNDTDAMAERVSGAASGLLTLLGIEADPLMSREHILIATLLDHVWRSGRQLTIGDLIGLIATPPLEKVGVLATDTFMPPDRRQELATRLNNLLASPAFRSWLEGEPLSIPRLLHTREGKPRISVLSIAHLSDRERMFFVTTLLHETIAWMRTQSGTGSLRAILYMDEIAGYFPPVANPPSKPPMLTLLKQARAFGLGVTLATQNPVDLDYKGLSNIGTWLLGRLQTERDKARVLDGLEGAMNRAGQGIDRDDANRLLSGLGSRTFLMNNVHDDGPCLFQTRWAMSFLAGPLARDQISRLTEARRDRNHDREPAEEKDTATSTEVFESLDRSVAPSRPLVPKGVSEKFVVATKPPATGNRLVYRPAVVGHASVHYVRVSADVDRWQDLVRVVRPGGELPDPFWESSEPLPSDATLADAPDERFEFGDLPGEWQQAATFTTLTKAYKDYLYRHHPLTLYKSSLLKAFAPPGCDEGEARVHFTQSAHEARDTETEKLRARYRSKVESLDKRILTAEQRVSRESDQYKQASLSSVLSVGASILGAFLGRKVVSKTNISKVSTAARGAGRAAQQRADVRRASDSLESLRDERVRLEESLQADLRELGERFDVDRLDLEPITIRPRKGDLRVSAVELVWTPWQVGPDGIALEL